MLKVGTKRRRTKAQIQAEKEEAALKETALKERIAKLNKDAELAQNNQRAADVLNEMIKQGIAIQDDNGVISVPSASKQRKRGE